MPAARRFAIRLTAAVAVSFASAGIAAVTAPQAHAASNVRFGLHDDAWLVNGPGTLEERLTKLDELGVQLVRFNLRWDAIARERPAEATSPADPAYDWTDDDAVLNGLRAHGIAVVLGLLGTPTWANGGRPSNYAPTSAQSFGAFTTAAAQRYSWVKKWLVWNEPNQQRWLRPTQPAIYVTRLLNPAYAALHATIHGVQVGGGVTAPRGATAGVSPVAWIRGMHAVGAHLDAYAHNPYPLSPKSESPRSGGCAHCATITMATIGKLVTEVSRNFGSARIWLTEYGYQTNPPDRLLGVSQLQQARYIGDAALVAYRTPRVDMLIQFLYRDEPNVDRFQSGLVRLDGAEKLAYTAFELPLTELSRAGTRTSLWGQLRAPAAGRSYRIQKLVGGTWTDVTMQLQASPAGYFRYTGTLPPGTQVRVVAGSITSPPLLVT